MLYDPAFYVLYGLFLYFITACSLVPWVAQQKGRSTFGWLLIALLWTPLFALIALAAVPDKLEEEPEPFNQRRDDSEIPEFKWRRG